jgi:hypothetical protein
VWLAARRGGAGSAEQQRPSSTTAVPPFPQFGNIASTGVSNAQTPVPVAQQADGAGSDRDKKIRKLNESFLKWAQKQLDANPLSIWKEGVKVLFRNLLVRLVRALTVKTLLIGLYRARARY